MPKLSLSDVCEVRNCPVRYKAVRCDGNVAVKRSEIPEDPDAFCVSYDGHTTYPLLNPVLPTNAGHPGDENK